jgi:hypothetical protein
VVVVDVAVVTVKTAVKDKVVNLLEYIMVDELRISNV